MESLKQLKLCYDALKVSTGRIHQLQEDVISLQKNELEKERKQFAEVQEEVVLMRTCRDRYWRGRKRRNLNCEHQQMAQVKHLAVLSVYVCVIQICVMLEYLQIGHNNCYLII